MKRFILIVGLIVLCSGHARSHGAASSTPPNFVIVFIDDMGYEDLGCFGTPIMRTPNIDRLAREGMRLTSFYAQPICGPSRTALMTGCYPLRVAERDNKKRHHPIVHHKETMIPEVLKSRGYATACFGKWDMAGHSQRGFQPDLMPNHQGFDYYFGTPSSNDGFVDLYRNTELVERKADMATLTHRYTQEAIDFIKRHKDHPFFVYIPHTMVHVKLAASSKFAGKSRRGIYGDCVEELDFETGRLVDTLKECGVVDNTYVVVTSDNGPWLSYNKDFRDGSLPTDRGGSAGPLRSGKVSTWEGGVRVPTVVWAPGRVPSGRTCDKMASTMDLLPTFAALAGAQMPDDRVIDGRDIRHLLAGQFDESDPGRTYCYYLDQHLQAIRQGPWKLHLPRPHKAPWLDRVGLWPGRHIGPKDAIGFDSPLLYNLDTDIGETTDVASQHPQVVEHLFELAEQARADIGDYDCVGSGARFFDEGPKRPLMNRWKDMPPRGSGNANAQRR